MAGEQVIAGRFAVGELIGQGGMGQVYRGSDHQSGQAVAIKLLKDELVADPDQVRRFEREGDALRALNHPNIVKVLASVEEQGRHYIVMEYVAGGSLGTLLKEQPQLPVERALQIALDLADALTRAHRLKIIHRDIKPMNVLIAEDGTPRLTDFEVAYMGDHSRMTQTGSMVGTYAYLSPEACNGQPPDERTDIWAFGVMLYEMLAGRRPFTGDQPATVITAILNREPPDLEELRPDLPPALVRLVRRMLEKDRERRVPSVRQVGAELEAIMRGETTPTPGSLPLATRILSEDDASRFATPTTPTAERTAGQATAVSATRMPSAEVPPAPAVAAPPPRSRLPWMIGGAAALLAVAALAFWIGGAGTGQNNAAGATAAPAAVVPPTTAPDPTVAPSPTVAPDPTPLPAVEPVGVGEYMVLVGDFEPIGTEQRDVARFIVDDLRQKLEVQIPNSNIRVRRYPAILTSDDAVATAERVGAPVVIWGTYSNDVIQASIQLGDTSTLSTTLSRTVMERTANLRLSFTDERNESLAPHVLQVINVLVNTEGNFYGMLRNVAMRDMIAAGVPVEGDSIAAHTSRYLSALTTDPARALEEVNAALTADSGNPIFYAYRMAGNIRLGNFEVALRDAETVRRQTQGRWVMPFYGPAYIYFVTGQPERALPAIETVIDQHPNDWYALTFRGAINYALGDKEKARADMERATELDPDLSFPYNYLMLLALHEGRLSDAKALYKTITTKFPDPIYGARILETLVGTTGNSLGPFLAAFGSLTFGQFEDTVRYLDASLALRDDNAEAYFMRGFARCNLKQYPEAETDYSRALELAPDFTLIHLLRAEVRQRQGNAEGARADIEAVQQSAQIVKLAPLVQAALAGEISCETLLFEQ